MLGEIIAAILGIVLKKPKEVDAVLAVFTKTLDRLDTVQAAHEAEIRKKEEAIQKALDAKLKSEQEIAKAREAVKGIQALFGK